MTCRLLEECIPYSYVLSCRKLQNSLPVFITNLIIVTSIQVVKAISTTSKMATKVPFYDYDLIIRKLTNNLINLTLPAPCISEGCIKIKVNLNFYFHTFLWCLKRFYAGLKGLHKTF